MSDVLNTNKKQKKLKSTSSYVIPYLVWISIFLILPTLILIFLSFSTYDFSANSTVRFSFANWRYIFGSEYAKNVFWPAIGRSMYTSVAVTLVCFIVGYPVALFMTKIKPIFRTIILAFLALPLWCNQVLRIVSWRTIFEMLNMNHNSLYELNIIIALTSMYLPFMILPIFTVLEKIDPKVVEASYDLGCTKTESFFKVVFPLSLGGIVSGVIMVFLPCLTTFEVSDAISYNTILLLGNLIYNRFQGTGGYNVGSIFSIITVIFTMVGFVLLLKVDKEGETLI